MIDYIKIKVLGVEAQQLLLNPLLDFRSWRYEDTGQEIDIDKHGKKIIPNRRAYFKGLEFRVYNNGTILLMGSLHKYWNSGGHNYDDFDFNAFLDVINDLKVKFNINPAQCVIRCLEVGINIIPIKSTQSILDYCFLHKTKLFKHIGVKDEGKYKQAEHSQYIIKLYDKARHYRGKGFEIPHDILRFEIKYLKMQKVNSLGIYNVQDIINKSFIPFKNELLQAWRDVLFYDFTIKASLTPKQQRFQNPLFWEQVSKNKTEFNRNKERLRKLTINNSEMVQGKIEKQILEKVDLLNPKCIPFYPLCIRSKGVHQEFEIIASEKRVCKITGLNISMQKDDSELLSHTGLKYYLKSDLKVFKQLKRRFLTDKWEKENIHLQIKELAHNIRNYWYNRTRKQKRLYHAEQLNLLSHFL